MVLKHDFLIFYANVKFPDLWKWPPGRIFACRIRFWGQKYLIPNEGRKIRIRYVKNNKKRSPVFFVCLLGCFGRCLGCVWEVLGRFSVGVWDVLGVCVGKLFGMCFFEFGEVFGEVVGSKHLLTTYLKTTSNLLIHTRKRICSCSFRVPAAPLSGTLRRLCCTTLHRTALHMGMPWTMSSVSPAVESRTQPVARACNWMWGPTGICWSAMRQILLRKNRLTNKTCINKYVFSISFWSPDLRIWV